MEVRVAEALSLRWAPALASLLIQWSPPDLITMVANIARMENRTVRKDVCARGVQIGRCTRRCRMACDGDRVRVGCVAKLHDCVGEPQWYPRSDGAHRQLVKGDESTINACVRGAHERGGRYVGILYIFLG